MLVCIFQFPIDPKIRHKWLEKYYLKEKFDKSTRRIRSIYFSMAAFNGNIKFHLSNLKINNLMLINFRISLITKRFFCFLLFISRCSINIVLITEDPEIRNFTALRDPSVNNRNTGE